MNPAAHATARGSHGESTKRPPHSREPSRGPTLGSGPKRQGPASKRLLAAEAHLFQRPPVLLACLGPITWRQPGPNRDLRGLHKATWQPLPAGTCRQPSGEGL